MTTTHTPGPWHVTGDAEGTMITDDTGKQLAVWPLQGGTLEQCANACLIAAAPDLLAAAIDALETFERRFPDSPTAHDLRAAIARATGEA